MFYVAKLPALLRSDRPRGLSMLECTLAETRRERPAVRYLCSTTAMAEAARLGQLGAGSDAANAEANRRAGLLFDRIVPAVIVQPS